MTAPTASPLRLAMLVAMIPCLLPAQPSADTRALAAWMALDAPPGDEMRAAEAIRRVGTGWTVDAQGNVIRRVGRGSPRRVIACGIDHSAFVVSGVTSGGYLRLHRLGNVPVHPLWDQTHEAQQVVVRTARGAVPGVVAVPNGHFARQHRGDTAVVGVDQLWVDVGATSAAEVDALGIALIDPVGRDVPPWEFAGHVAGADASGRAGCAAVTAVGNATAAPPAGEFVFIISAMRSFGWMGLSGALARLGAVDELTLVVPARAGAPGSERVARRRLPPPGAIAVVRPADSVTALSVRTVYPGTLVESVRGADVAALRAILAAAVGTDPARAPWLVPALPAAMAVDVRRDAHTELAETIRRLSDLPGVPGHEFRVRQAVREMLPDWARRRAVVDSAGNLFLAVGPARDTMVVIAHMDEVSHVVTGIRGDGTVTLQPRGGVIPSAWEGQPALLHFDPVGDDVASPSLPGLFIPRDSATVRAPRALAAWFGLDSAALVARGVRIGQGVTAYKRAQRLAATRFTGRALDDRVGTAALLAALAGLDTTQLDHTVIFAWSVAEEGGLVGARALARQLGPTVRRVYAIDTFVSSDTPLEAPTFAYVPLGSGAVLRALDDGIGASRAERDRVVRVARQAGVPLQIGTTHGSTDATPFLQWGAVGSGLSWPGRFSHSPAEVLDLRDVAGLVRLVRAAALAPSR